MESSLKTRQTFLGLSDASGEEIVLTLEDHVRKGLVADKKALYAIQRGEFTFSQLKRMHKAACEGVILQKRKGNAPGMLGYADILAELHPRIYGLSLINDI